MSWEATVTHAPKSHAIDRTASKAKTGADADGIPLAWGNKDVAQVLKDLRPVAKGGLVFLESFPAGAESGIPPRGGVLRLIQERLKKIGPRSAKKVWFWEEGNQKSVANAKVGPPSVIDKLAFEPDARSRALLRGRKMAEANLLASGGAYNLEEVRTLMQGVSRQRIYKRVQDGSLLAVPGPSNNWHYPTVQFQADGSVVKGLRAVREALPTRNPWAVLNFLVQPDDRLNGRKPIELLKAGEIEDVVDAARSMGQQGG
jgi:hypothetical protein